MMKLMIAIGVLLLGVGALRWASEGHAAYQCAFTFTPANGVAAKTPDYLPFMMSDHGGTLLFEHREVSEQAVSFELIVQPIRHGVPKYDMGPEWTQRDKRCELTFTNRPWRWVYSATHLGQLASHLRQKEAERDEKDTK